jgi:hypothetical protein
MHIMNPGKHVLVGRMPDLTNPIYVVSNILYKNPKDKMNYLVWWAHLVCLGYRDDTSFLIPGRYVPVRYIPAILRPRTFHP